MGIMDSIFAITNEGRRVETLMRTAKSAKNLKKKACQRCGACCHVRSCELFPDEVKDIAQYLELPVKEFIEHHLVIDRKNGSDIYFLRVAAVNISDLTGQFIPGHRTFGEGPCIYLKSNEDGTHSCFIHDTKPRVAKSHRCWSSKSESDMPEDVRKKVVEMEQEAFIAKLLKKWSGNVLKKKFGIDGEKLEEETNESEE